MPGGSKEKYNYKDDEYTTKELREMISDQSVAITRVEEAVKNLTATVDNKFDEILENQKCNSIKIDAVKTDVTILKVKCGIYGGVLGFIAGLSPTAFSYILNHL